jgi:N-methylhydantoinase B/oxoprolinase/acetone carboxylase alpha subunit
VNEERSQTLAHLVASGLSLVDASHQLGITLPNAKVIAKSPLFEALVTKYQRENTLTANERLRSDLEAMIEDIVIPRLRELIESERETTSLSACRAAGDLYKSLVTQDSKSIENSLTIVLSERESATLHELMQLPPIDVSPAEPVQNARELILALEASEDVL